MHAADFGEDSRLPGRDPDRGSEEEEMKRTRSAVSTDTTTASSDVETIDVEDAEGDVQLLKATMAPSPVVQAAETPRPAPEAQGRSTSNTGC
jgi:hypothetical protein